MPELTQSEFVEFADLLTDRQAEAFWHRRVEGSTRAEAAAEMGSSKSNVDNLERAAHQKIMQANNLVSVVDATGVEIEGVIGVCSQCDDPTRELRPNPTDNSDLRKKQMVCPDCHDQLKSA